MTVILVDAKNALFRFGWAFKGLMAGQKFTGATYGIIKTLTRLKRRFPDSRFMMVWDGHGKSWRHSFWPGYKANREKTGKSIDEGVARILAQINTVQHVTQLMGIPQFQMPGLEGDDAIALIAQQLLSKEHKVVIYSSDRDFLQLMPQGVKVIHDTEEPVNVGWVNLKFRCTPDKVLLVRSLAGDKSDSIPGIIDGVGTVKAAALINAGLNPSYRRFDQHSASVQREMSHLSGRWEEIHRNYQLMRLLDFNQLTKRYDEDTCFGICRAVGSSLNELFSYTCNTTCYRTFLGILGELEMVEFISDRYRIWRLQRIVSVR